jgi:hypothetical protein
MLNYNFKLFLYRSRSPVRPEDISNVSFDPGLIHHRSSEERARNDFGLIHHRSSEERVSRDPGLIHHRSSEERARGDPGLNPFQSTSKDNPVPFVPPPPSISLNLPPKDDDSSHLANLLQSLSSKRSYPATKDVSHSSHTSHPSTKDVSHTSPHSTKDVSHSSHTSHPSTKDVSHTSHSSAKDVFHSSANPSAKDSSHPSTKEILHTSTRDDSHPTILDNSHSLTKDISVISLYTNPFRSSASQERVSIKPDPDADEYNPAKRPRVEETESAESRDRILLEQINGKTILFGSVREYIDLNRGILEIQKIGRDEILSEPVAGDNCF